MATGVVTYSKTAATNSSSDSAQNWAEGQAPSSVNDSARAGMASVAKWRDDLNGSLVTGGTTTAYTLTTNQTFAALTAGYQVAFQVNATNAATVTLAVDGLAAKPLRSAAGVELLAGALLIGAVYRATYFTSNSGEWIIESYPVLGDAQIAAAKLASNSVTTAKIADANVTLAKLESRTANTLIGRYTGSTGVPQEVTVSTGLALNTSTGALTTTTNPTLIPNYISGLTLSTAGSSATMSIAAGVASDSTNTVLMNLSAAIAKTTSSWAVGNTNGGLDTGAIANSTWYHFYQIERVDTGVVDVIFSLSASAPSLPTNYTIYRRIGSGKTNGSGQWTAFTQVGDEFLWKTNVNDIAAGTATSTSGALFTMTVPTGIQVTAIFTAQCNGTGTFMLISSPDQTNDAASVTNASMIPGATSVSQFRVRTNTSAQARQRTDVGSTTYTIFTTGWVDTRGKN